MCHTHVEQLAERNERQLWLIFGHVAFRVDDLAQLEHFLEHVHVGLLSTRFSQTAGNRPEVGNQKQLAHFTTVDYFLNGHF